MKRFMLLAGLVLLPASLFAGAAEDLLFMEIQSVSVFSGGTK